jgi:3',5'-cyclic AMP phosphodiesterase CpdA
MTLTRWLVVAAVTMGWSPVLMAQTRSQASTNSALTLPMRANSVRFLVIGDGGTGDKAQVETANQMARYHARFPFTFAILLGDNIYGSERPQDFKKKFETPYKALLDAGVEFHAALGNHDDPNQKFYKPFNLGGQRYRTFKKGNVRFFVLDSNYMDPEQIKWLEKELAASGSDWKIAYFHHPLYTTAKRGPELELREIVEPIFVKHGVDVVFQGHEHIYERLHAQKGIQYFVAGGSAKLRSGDVKPRDAIFDVGFATDRSFMLVEIARDQMFFQTISRTGETVDKGTIRRSVDGAPARVTSTRPARRPATRAPAKPAAAKP